MKKEFNKEKLTGYSIGTDIEIHGHIDYPDSWLLTIRPLRIYGKILCSKSCTEQEIARYINLELHKKLNIVNALIEQTIPFT